MVFRLLAINVLSLCIQDNSLLSLGDFDLGVFLDTLMYSRMCMVNGGTLGLPTASKLSRHSGILMAFYVKKMMLKPIQYSVFWLGPHSLCGKCHIPTNIHSTLPIMKPPLTKKLAIMKENLHTKYIPFTYNDVTLNKKPPITKQNLHIFFFSL